MNLKHSYSRIKNYLACPAYYKFRHIDKVLALSDDPDYLTIGSLIHEALKEYTRECYRRKVTNLYEEGRRIFDEVAHKSTASFEEIDEALKIFQMYIEANEIELEGLYGVEEKICLSREMEIVEWDSDEAFFRAVVDKLFLVGENCKIVDYKTGNSFKADRIQLEIYAWLISILYPKVNFFEFEIDYVRFNHKETWKLTKDEVLLSGDKILKRIEQIEKDEKFEPKVGSLCGSCPFISQCPAMNVNNKIAPPHYPEIKNEEEAEEALELLLSLSNKSGAVQDSLKAFVEKNREVVVGDMSAHFTLIETTKWDVPKLMEWATSKGIAILEALSVDKNKLKKTLSAELIDHAKMFAVTKPSLRFTVGKVKEQKDE